MAARRSDPGYGRTIKGFSGYFLQLTKGKDLFDGELWTARIVKKGRVVIEEIRSTSRAAEEAARSVLARRTVKEERRIA